MNFQALAMIVEGMTLDEKIAQLMQLAGHFYAENGGEVTGPMADLGISDSIMGTAGSVLGVSGAKDLIRIQKDYLRNSSQGVPLLFMADVIHGYRTIFPIPLALGCSWDLVAAESSAAVAAKEAAVSGVHVTFAPMVDLVRDPRWGRVLETTGEDHYLNGQFARAFVRGFQGHNLRQDTDRVAACVKHFAAYGAAEGGRDYNTVDMSEHQLRSFYLPAYQAAIEAGCQLVMTSFNTIAGMPSTVNRWLLRDVLREEWDFTGVVISDWDSVKEVIAHGVAHDEAEAATKALRAGVDIEMMSPCYVKHLHQLVCSGVVEESLIDEAVLRILQLKDSLGLFENPYRGANEEREREVVLCEEHRLIARDIAEKSCVLLKNDSVLPLETGTKIALIGPFANTGDILGAWSWKGQSEEVVTLAQALESKIDIDQLTIAQGCDVTTGTNEQREEAIRAARGSDVIVLALGEASNMSGEAASRGNICLPLVQLELIATLKTLKKPIVVVLFNGRPLDLHGVLDQVDAVLEAWYPGTEGGTAIVNLLFGDRNPSGKLTMSFPYTVGQIPVYYNHLNTGRPEEFAGQSYVSNYLDIPNEPLLPFGFGLSYTHFSYSNFALSTDVLEKGESLLITVEVKNTGEYSGEEVVQLYVRDLVGEVARPLKELKAFEKILLQPGEKKQVTFSVTEEQLRYYHSDLRFESDAGEFEVFVGSSSVDVQKQKFTLRC